MITVSSEENIKVKWLLAKDENDFANLESEIRLNMILAKRNIAKLNVKEEYICIAVVIHKKNGETEVVNLNLMTELFKMADPIEFNREVMCPQGKKLPLYIANNLKLTIDDIDYFDIKVFAFNDNVEIEWEIKKLVGKQDKGDSWQELIRVVKHAWEYGIHSNDMTLGEIEEDISGALNRFAKEMNLPQVNWEEENASNT